MMNRQVLTTVLAAAGLAWGCVMARGEELARWDSTGANKTNASFAAAAWAEGVTVANLVRGTGLKAGAAGDTFPGTGYDTSSFESAMNGGDYWETCLTPNGSLLALDSLTYAFQRSSAGPSLHQWAVKVGASGTWTALGSPMQTATDYSKTVVVDLSGVAVTDQPVWFRLAAWNASSSSGTGNFGKGDVLTFAGALQSLDGPPIVRFTPSVGLVDEGQTLEMAVAVLPAGSVVSTWSVAPTPAGACSLSGGKFTFTPAAEDAQQARFTLSVTATNAQGATTGEAAVVVSEKAPDGTLTLSFDNERQPTWSGAAGVEIPAGSGISWSMANCMIGEDAGNDKLYGGVGKALRFAYDEECVFASKGKILDFGTQTGDIQTNGIAEIRFWYGVYGEDAGEESAHPVRPPIVTELSDDGKYWVEVDRVSSAGSEEEPQERRIAVGVETPVYFRIRIEGVSGSSRVNVDQLRIVPKVTEKNQLNLFLLQYNVTPGDLKTANTNDWDGDGRTNIQEFRAKTNPYDKNSK